MNLLLSFYPSSGTSSFGSSMGLGGAGSWEGAGSGFAAAGA